MESRTYEGLFLLNPAQTNQDWDKVKNEAVAMVERREGNVVSAKKWGERKLAYEINGHKRGTYLLMYFQIPSHNLSTLQRDLQLSELVMRNLILVHKRPIEQEDEEENSDSAEDDSPKEEKSREEPEKEEAQES